MKQYQRGNFLIGSFLIITIVFYYAGLHLDLQELGFTILFPSLFLLALALDIKTIAINSKEITIYLLFLILSMVSIFYENIVVDQFLFSTPKILASFMAAYVAVALNKNNKNYEDFFHYGYLLILFFIIFFEYLLGNFNILEFYKPQVSRGVFLYNANYYSYISLFANFSIFRLYLKYPNKLTVFGCFILPILALAMSFTTQSRSGLLFVILINIAFWFWVNTLKKNVHPLKKLFRKVILVVGALFFSIQFFNFYSQSSIQERATQDGGRGYLFKRGLEVFAEYPFTGVGTGNFIYYNKGGLFTHSSYSEALAEHGLFIGGLMILVFVLPLIKSFKLYWENKTNTEVKLSLLFFATFLIYNNVYVFYKASFAMMYFFLMIGIHYQIESRIKKLDGGQ
ncbi:O-antigen ligase family protein [Maribacter sp. 2210JD10-5]|uniref:O-antigen ligase family protein n=1 Tax=Maribacter sp. 2210JD10-5 TaxID=3386272 RepID=UPI0039BD2B1A